MFPLVMLVRADIQDPVAATFDEQPDRSRYRLHRLQLPFATFLMQSFFDGIPKDLEEAAMIDGATQFTAFRQIILPLTLPGIAATLGFVFCGLERAPLRADADQRQRRGDLPRGPSYLRLGSSPWISGR